AISDIILMASTENKARLTNKRSLQRRGLSRVPWLLKLPSGRDTDTASYSAISAQIVSHATIGRKRMVDTSYRLNAKCLCSVVETHVRVYCESLVFRQIDAAECH